MERRNREYRPLVMDLGEALARLLAVLAIAVGVGLILHFMSSTG